eukprot:4858799-Pleurochrysis_carterae.AAC.1
MCVSDAITKSGLTQLETPRSATCRAENIKQSRQITRCRTAISELLTAGLLMQMKAAIHQGNVQ